MSCSISGSILIALSAAEAITGTNAESAVDEI